MYTLTHHPDNVIASSIDGFLAIAQFDFDPQARFILKPDNAAVVIRIETSRSEKPQFDELSKSIPTGNVDLTLSESATPLLEMHDFSAAQGLAEHAVDEASTITVLTGRRTTRSWLTYSSPEVLDFGRTIADAQGHYYWNADLTLGQTGLARLSYRRAIYDYRRASYDRLFALGPSCKDSKSVFQFFIDCGARMEVRNNQLVRIARNPLPKITFTDHRRGDQTSVFFGPDVDGTAQALGAQGAVFVLGGSFTTLQPAAIQMLLNAALTGSLMDAVDSPLMKLGPQTASSTVLPLDSLDRTPTPRPPLLEGFYLRQLATRSQPAIFL